MRRSIYILFLFISCNSFPQSESDSARYERLLRNTRYELEELNNNYRNLQDSYSILQLNFDTLENEVIIRDSLYGKHIEFLNSSIDSLQIIIKLNNERLSVANEKLKEEIYRTRKGNATLLIIIFSLLVLNFVYFLYRNYRLKTYVNHEVLTTSMDMERKHIRLKKKIKKRFNSFSKALDKKLKKQNGKKGKKK